MEFCNPNSLRYSTRDSCCGSLLGDSGREEMGQTWGAGVQRVTRWCGGRPLAFLRSLLPFQCRRNTYDLQRDGVQRLEREPVRCISIRKYEDGTMGTTIGSGRVLEAHRNETVWLQQMQEEEGLSTFSRGSGPRRPKSSQHRQQLLAVKESLEKLVPGVAENGSVSCGTQSQSAAVPSLPASPTEFPRTSGNLPCSESTMDQGEAPRKLPQSIRRRWSYKQAVSKAAEKWHHMDDEALTPPCTKTALPVFPGRKVVQPVRMFLQTVRKKQMLVTLTSASRPSVMKSFIKRNTVHHLDAEEKELQQLENLKKKEEAELLRKQKVEEDQHQRLEEMKMKREEHLWKALKARKQAEQLEVEKKKRTEQKLEAKQKPLAKKASKKTGRKLEEAEMMLKQEEEAWRQKRLQQQEEEREQKRQRKVAEALRNAVQQRQRERQLALEREMQRKREEERLQAEWERALQLHKERLLKELEEEQKREQDQRQEQEPKKLQKEQEKKAKEAKVVAAAAGAPDRWLDVTTHVQLWQPKGPGRDKEVSFHLQTPVGNSSEMTPQDPKGSLKIIPDSDGMDLCSDDSTDDEFQPGRPIPAWATGFQLRQATIYQYYVPPDIDQIFGTILSPDLEDIFQKSKPRYHTRTSSALWDSPPLARVPEFEGTVV
ncbi:inner centromere protein-like isoform X2 [Notamacropus eugenii]|uniref:inner centromere protein-like isoform X2 n=1 Tax=Notamacropus eugenii TaxID=9315 RepID=UPI003B67AB52